jgi:hypothetical protein
VPSLLNLNHGRLLIHGGEIKGKSTGELEVQLEESLNDGGLKTDIFSISAHKVFTDSQNNINAQYSISGMQYLSSEEILMDDKKEMINCVSQM